MSLFVELILKVSLLNFPFNEGDLLKMNFKWFIGNTVKFTIEFNNNKYEAIGQIQSIHVSPNNVVYYCTIINSVPNGKDIVWPAECVLNENLEFVSFDNNLVFC